MNHTLLFSWEWQIQKVNERNKFQSCRIRTAAIYESRYKKLPFNPWKIDIFISLPQCHNCSTDKIVRLDIVTILSKEITVILVGTLNHSSHIQYHLSNQYQDLCNTIIPINIKRIVNKLVFDADFKSTSKFCTMRKR